MEQNLFIQEKKGKWEAKPSKRRELNRTEMQILITSSNVIAINAVSASRKDDDDDDDETKKKLYSKTEKHRDP